MPAANVPSAQPSTRAGNPVVELREVSKRFGATLALDEVSLELRPGEVCCLAGENGAGKSTLIRVLTGALRRDSGHYLIDSAPVADSWSPADARAAGIGVVYQELSLLGDLSVAENLLMGRLPSRSGLVRRSALRAEAERRLARVGLDWLDPNTLIADLGAANRQLVEIAKVLADDARVVIFDEPTTALSADESAALLRRIGQLRADGVAILYVTHRLEEMFEVGDRVAVLRDGRLTSTGAMHEFTEDSLIAAMVGRDVQNLYPDGDRAQPSTQALLRVRGLRPPGGKYAIDLDVRAGEILGIAGLLGSGRSELLRAIFGADRAEAGSVRVADRKVPHGNPSASVRAGVGLLSEDRKELGLLPDLTIRENAAMASVGKFASNGFLSKRKEAATVDAALDRMRLSAKSYDQEVSTLSGGNQQKVLVARWLVSNVRVLLFDEPTKGIDVGAKAEMYSLIGDLAKQGMAIVVVSSYLPELLGLVDRIVVLRAGGVVGELPAAEATEELLVRMSSTGTPVEADSSEDPRPSEAGASERQARPDGGRT